MGRVTLKIYYVLVKAEQNSVIRFINYPPSECSQKVCRSISLLTVGERGGESAYSDLYVESAVDIRLHC